MPIIPGTATATVGPYGTYKCRPVRIRASGEGSAIAATGAGANREARAEARRMLDRAVRRVRTIRCPKKGGCAAGWPHPEDRLGHTTVAGQEARRRRQVGSISATLYQFYYMICRCPE